MPRRFSRWKPQTEPLATKIVFFHCCICSHLGRKALSTHKFASQFTFIILDKMKTNKVATATSTAQRTIVHAVVVIDDPRGLVASTYIEELSNPTKKTISSSPTLFPLRSCFKLGRCTTNCSRNLASQLDYHVHFDIEQDSRWSSGCPRCKAQPLKCYMKRNSISDWDQSATIARWVERIIGLVNSSIERKAK